MNKKLQIPRFQLQRVYEDGSRDEPKLHALTGIDAACRMGRRGFLLTSAIGTGLLAGLTAMAGCVPQAVSTGAMKSTQIPGQTDLEPVTFPAQASPPRSTNSVKAHKGGIMDLAFSPDGKLLASIAAEDTTIKLWSIFDAKLLHTITEEQSPEGIAFSPEGKTLYSSTIDGALAARKAPFKGKKTVLDKKAGNGIVAVSPDGNTLALLAGWTGPQLRRLPDGALLREINAKYFHVAFTPDSAMLAGCGSSSSKIGLHAVSSGKVLREWNVTAHRLAISPDGSLLAARNNQALWVWDIASGKRHSALAVAKSTSSAGAVAFSPSGDWLATVADNGYPVQGVMLLPKPFKASGPLLMGHNDTVSKLAFSPDGRFLAVGLSNGGIFIWEMPQGQTEARLHAVLLDAAAMKNTVSIRQAATIEKSVYIGPCGDPLPTGAVCTCNCVSGKLAVPRSPNRLPVSVPGGTYCTCNKICTCVPIK